MIYQPNENIVMMDYIPYIQQMISANSKANAGKTRSKRKRLYLPLSDDNEDVLTYNRPLIDEVCTKKKEKRDMLFFFFCVLTCLIYF